MKLVLGKHNLTAPITSYSRPEITTKSQSYFFTHSVKAIAVTTTARGITSKQILIGTIGDQVHLFPLNWMSYANKVKVSFFFILLKKLNISLLNLQIIRSWHLINGSWIHVGLLIHHKKRKKRGLFL